MEEEDAEDDDEGEEAEEDEAASRGERSIKPWARSEKKSYGSKAHTICKHVPVKRCTSKYVGRMHCNDLYWPCLQAGV